MLKVDFDKLYRDGVIDECDNILAHRHESFRIVYDYLKVKKGMNFVTTGSMHNNLLHAHGCSDLIYGALAKDTNSKLHTVDLDETHIEACKEFTQYYQNYINYNVGDSIFFLKNFYKEIDFLYLDSYDFVEGHFEESRQHCLKELESCWDKLKDGSLIVIDDCDVSSLWFQGKLDDKDNQGKSYYAHKELMSRGIELLYDGYQRVYKVIK